MRLTMDSYGAWSLKKVRPEMRERRQKKVIQEKNVPVLAGNRLLRGSMAGFIL